MADHDLTINQDGMFGQLENLLSEQETQLLTENEQELEGEQEPETEQNEEQEQEQENEQEQEQEQEEEQEQEQEQEQEKQNVDASVVADRWPGWPGESVFRMLVPSQKVGGIIGRKGEFIKKMCEEAKARIKILDGIPGSLERAVLVSAKEEPGLSLPPAVDGLLRVHNRVVDGLDDSSHAPASGVKVTTRLLVPAGQAGNLIGKQGTTVKAIQEKSDCIVRIIEDLPTFALQDDRIVEVVGEPTAVHKAVELVALHLRKFLVDRSIIPIFEMQMQNPLPPPQMDDVPPIQPWGPPPYAPNVPGPNYRATPPHYRTHAHFVPPPQQQHNSYYPPAELPPPLEKQPHQGISTYGREAPMSSNNQPSQSMSTQVLQQIQIPLSYADAVIGTAGGTISYIRRASGATVTIQETRGVPGEMTVEITGNASQVQTAQQLIQNYMADATAGAGQPQPAAATADQTYNPYAAAAAATLGGGAYAPQTANPSLGGGYGSVYGTNYGY